MDLNFYTPETFPSLAEGSNKIYVVFGQKGADKLGIYFAGVTPIPGKAADGQTPDIKVGLLLKLQGTGGLEPDIEKLGFGKFASRGTYFSGTITTVFARTNVHASPSVSELRALYDKDPTIESTLYGALSALCLKVYGDKFETISPQHFQLLMQAQFEMRNFTAEPHVFAAPPELI